MPKQSKDFLLCFKEHLKQKHFFVRRDRILVACSGGPDSVALFHLLKMVSSDCGWKLALVHYNHQLRKRTAHKDELFVRKLARKYGVPFYRGTGDVAMVARKTNNSIEECARSMRYEFFLKVAREKKGAKIALAHTQDDQAETVLMRILQGTGLRGLAGIREKMTLGQLTILRPLLAFTKKEILAFLKQYRIRFCSDESNRSLQFVRNRIRLKLIPSLQRDYNPRLIETLSRLPSIVAEENELFAELEAMAWPKVLKCATPEKIELRRKVFRKFPSSLQFRLVERALKKLDSQSGLSFDAWQRIRSILGRERHRCSLPKDIDLTLTPKIVSIYKKNSLHNQV